MVVENHGIIGLIAFDGNASHKLSLMAGMLFILILLICPEAQNKGLKQWRIELLFPVARNHIHHSSHKFNCKEPEGAT